MKALPAFIVIVAAAIGAAVVIPAVEAHQDGRGGKAGGGIEPFVGALRQAVERRDRRAVAGLFHYPATASASGLRIPLESSASVIKMYDLLFTPAVRCAIVQRPPTRAGTGLSIGGGTVWAQRAGSGYEITRVIVPAAGGAGSARRKPVHIVFPINAEQPAQFSGALVRDEHEAYVLSTRKGQRLRARIDGFRGRDAELRLVALAGGQPVDARDGVRVWDGIIPATGDYRLDVIRRAPYCDPVLVYVLAVTLR